MLHRSLVASLTLFLGTSAWAAEEDDPFLYLEEVEGERALEWVEEHNAHTLDVLARGSDFEGLEDRLLSIFDSDERIASVSKIGEGYYNFWRDAEHPRGLWRRTSLASYRTGEPEWDVVIDLDALAEAEEENWVWKRVSCVRPSYDRCLIALSRGGADATVVREFDLTTKAFVEDGFTVPEAKTRTTWVDRDTVLVGTDMGEGSLTESGYPRQIRRWARGTNLAASEIVFEGEVEDVAAFSYHDDESGRTFVGRTPVYYRSFEFELGKKGPKPIDKPESADVYPSGDWVFLELRDDWTVDDATYSAGSLLVADSRRFFKGKRDFTVLFEPTETTSLRSFAVTDNHVVVTTLDDVSTTLTVHTPRRKGWSSKPLAGAPELGRASFVAVDPIDSDAYFLVTEGFLTPSTLSYGDLSTGEIVALDSLPSFFDTAGLEVSQHFATSDDGTRVPYFQIARSDVPTDGSTPTLLYGYGGFEISLTPRYLASVGAGWLERGGAYVLANIRGGGEYGPKWHQAALRENRHRAYEDFAAVARDLGERGLADADHLGIAGRSNGGLLMGNMYTTYPELFGAVDCGVPLLDMRRYTKLLAGASWVGEYGDPDVPEDWAFLKAYSPYHNIDPEETDAPPLFVFTSTRDDRVHPGHARKFVAALEAIERPDVLYYENIEGGHGAAANNDQAAFMRALSYTFLWKQLADGSVAEAE